jgi:hypothetical protein
MRNGSAPNQGRAAADAVVSGSSLDAKACGLVGSHVRSLYCARRPGGARRNQSTEERDAKGVAALTPGGVENISPGAQQASDSQASLFPGAQPLIRVSMGI